MEFETGMSNLVSKLVYIGHKSGTFKISFSTFWRGAPKCTETELKKSQPRQNVLKLILKSPRFVQFGANLSQFG